MFLQLDRIRPLDPNEKVPRESWTSQGPNTVTSLDPKHKNVSYSYGIVYVIKITVADFVYGKECHDTHEIYEDIGAEIVQSVMQGYNGRSKTTQIQIPPGTIFAYGQTSSGKTYTMMVWLSFVLTNKSRVPMKTQELYQLPFMMSLNTLKMYVPTWFY